jgi:hypothetical protein
MKDGKRLLEETRNEATKLNKLNVFMASNEFPKLTRIEKTLLYRQCRIMNEFVEVLGLRLENYKIQFSHKEAK